MTSTQTASANRRSTGGVGGRLRTPLAAVALTALVTACGTTVPTSQSGQVAGGDALGGSSTGSGALPDGSGTTTGAVVGTGSSGSSPQGTSGSLGSSSGATSGTGGSVTSGSTGSALPGTSGGSSGASAAGIPTTGPGWDRTFVYVGVNTQKDVATAAQSAGANGLDAGDQEGQANAVVAYLNAHGGIFGRKVKAVFHDQSTVGAATDPDKTGNASCSYFTEDRKVIAVLNPVTLIDVDSFRSCLAKKKIPLFSASVAGLSQASASRFAPYFYQSVATTWDALAPVLVQQLKTMKYFDTAWNTSTGASTPGKAKVGILTPDTPDGVRTGQILDNALARVGSRAVNTFRFSTNNNNADMSSAVLQFRSAGVDHVIGTESSLVAFQLQAQSQGYHPRYGVHTLNAPITFLQSNGGPNQNRGDIGVGWAPAFDVDDAHDPGSTNPGVPLCNGIMKAGGQNYTGKRLARAVAYAFCDGLRLIVDGAKAGGGLTGLDIYNGMLKIAPGFNSAFSFAPGLKPGRLTIPGGVRPLAWNSTCDCFQYTSSKTVAL